MSGKAELRHFDEIGDEESFHSFNRTEEFVRSTANAQTWSPFEDLDDSGHFTVSPDGERAFSGSSRSHSPCLSSAQLVLQMQHSQSDMEKDLEEHRQLQCPSLLIPSQKKLISSRPMTVKVPQSLGACASIDESSDVRSLTFMQSFPGMGSSEHASYSLPSSINHSSLPLMGNGDKASGPREDSCEYLRTILVNFNSLYMEKLKMIDDLAADGNEERRKLLMQKKASMLEDWAKDVCVNNMVLVHTVEELEREANRKVAALQKKMTESTQLAKEHMKMIKKYEEQVKLLLKNHSDTEEKNLVLKIELEKLKSECRSGKDRMSSLLKDNEGLLTLICRIRDMGVWDVSDLDLQRSSYDQIFGMYPNLAGGEVRTVFTREKASRMQDSEEKVSKLEEQLHNLQKTQMEAASFIVEKDKKIEELEHEIRNVLTKAHYCEKECNEYKRSLLETQEKLIDATRRLSQSTIQPYIVMQETSGSDDHEMAELIQELRQIKSQLNTALEDKQSAKDESSHVKQELGKRLNEMHEIQNVFHSLATEVVNSRAAFLQGQEKEVQLRSLKSEIQTYQSRCSTAEDTIRNRGKEIRYLQMQMNEIHRKMFELEERRKGSSHLEDKELSHESIAKPAVTCPSDDQMDKFSCSSSKRSSCDSEKIHSVSINPGAGYVQFQSTTSHPEQSSESKCQEKESMEELLSRLTREKDEMEERFKKELEDKNIELKMQKVTIQHLQDAYVALKRGQPIPVPQTGKVLANGNSNGHHKLNNNNNNHSQVLDV